MQMYAVYDENEIGALDCDVIEGYIAHDSDLILQYAEEFKRKQNEDVSIMGEYCERYTYPFLYLQTENIAKLMTDRMKIVEKEYSSSEDEVGQERLVVDARTKDKWDCESILSTYNNIYNHTKLIPEPSKVIFDFMDIINIICVYILFSIYFLLIKVISVSF